MPKITAPPAKYRQGFLSQLDGRNALTITMRDMWEQMTADLGGEDRLSLAQRMLVERALWLHFWLRQQEESLGNGGEFDAGKHAALTNSLIGVLAKLGLERQSRDLSLADVIKRGRSE